MNEYEIKEQLKRLQTSKIKSPALQRAIKRLEELLKPMEEKANTLFEGTV